MHVLGLAGVISQGKAEEPPDLRLPGEIARTGLHTTLTSPPSGSWAPFSLDSSAWHVSCITACLALEWF